MSPRPMPSTNRPPEAPPARWRRRRPAPAGWRWALVTPVAKRTRSVAPRGPRATNGSPIRFCESVKAMPSQPGLLGPLRLGDGGARLGQPGGPKLHAHPLCAPRRPWHLDSGELPESNAVRFAAAIDFRDDRYGTRARTSQHDHAGDRAGEDEASKVGRPASAAHRHPRRRQGADRRGRLPSLNIATWRPPPGQPGHPLPYFATKEQLFAPSTPRRSAPTPRPTARRRGGPRPGRAAGAGDRGAHRAVPHLRPLPRRGRRCATTPPPSRVASPRACRRAAHREHNRLLMDSIRAAAARDGRHVADERWCRASCGRC